MTDLKKQTNKAEEALIEDVYADFKRRQEERRAQERRWQLNLNFLSGNQYCGVNSLGEIEGDDGGYFWQEKRVYNYIAPTYDLRCSKLSGIRPKLCVRAASDEDDDRRAAKLSSAILKATYEDCGVDDAVSGATVWSEACGSAFYKIMWDSAAGREIGITEDGEKVTEGKIKIAVVSPFEIYPDCLSEEGLYTQPSIIQARAVPVGDIYAAYGVELAGRDINAFTLSSPPRPSGKGLAEGAGVKHGYEVVIERYIRPNKQFERGRLTIVAGGKLLFDGDLPYVNGEGGTRTYPFIRQHSIPQAGSFFGISVIDRLIPLQRAYNAVKNRKHEFLNRIAMGVVAVEDGSLDVDELAEDGLQPGKILVYRQGGNPPEMLTLGSVPSEFTQEEERLEEEFAKISGINDVTQNANAFTSVTSATGLQIIIEQDEARLNMCYEQIKSALKEIGKNVLRLYRQFASGVRLLRLTGSDDTLSVVSFTGSDITGDDVIIEADSDVNLTPARRRAALFEMIDKGLFTGENGKIAVGVKARLLETLGYNAVFGERDLDELHRQRCAEENQRMKQGEQLTVKDYDDDAIHIKEHTAYLLSEKLTADAEARICEHLNLHNKKISEVKYEG